MKKSFRKNILFLFILNVLLSFNVVAFSEEITNQQNQYNGYFETLFKTIDKNYNGNVEQKTLLEGSLKGIFDSMDPYTNYFTVSEAESFQNSIEGSFKGIGISMFKLGEYVIVTKVFDSSPAQKAGVSVGDKIVEVNGKKTNDMEVGKVSALILGEAGTTVDLGISKGNEEGLINLKVIRDDIVINPITYEVRDDIAYLKIDSFNSNVEFFLNKELEKIDEKGINKIILDLRGNPGGRLDQAVLIAKKFIPAGPIVTVDYKSPEIRDEEYFSELANLKYKIAVLVNQDTASASEILAGAIKDTNAGILIGTKTFGKAKVQQVIPILTPDAQKKYKEKTGVDIVNGQELAEKYNIEPLEEDLIGYAKITIGKYKTPSGKDIDEVGITPDFVVENSDGINMSFNGLKMSKVSKLSLNSNGLEVYYAENILKLLGYDVDDADLILDEKTVNAVAKIQLDNGLYPYGVLDYSTQDLMNAKLSDLDNQYKKAVNVLNN